MNTRQESATMIAAAFAAVVGAGLVYKGGEWTRQRSRQGGCVSNLKQMGLGMMQYGRDYDEKMPLAHNWSTALFPYTRNPALFQCPDRLDVSQGYALHRLAAQANLSAFSNPAKTIMVFDSDGPNTNTSDTGASLPPRLRHPDGYAIAFMDGHVKVMTRPDFKWGYDAEFFRLNRIAARDSKRFWKIINERYEKQIAAQKKSKKP